MFELDKQPRVRVRDFRRTLTAPELNVYERIERRELLEVGTAQQVADQRTAMQNQYRAHAAELLGLLADAERAYASGCRQHFKEEGKPTFDETAWTTFALNIGFARAEDANAVKALKDDLRFSTRTGHFKPDEYQLWAEGTFVPALTATFKKHRDFRESTIKPIEPRGEPHADALVSIVLEKFKDYTRSLYERAKLDVPESLRSVPAVDPAPAQARTRRLFEAERLLLLRIAGVPE